MKYVQYILKSVPITNLLTMKLYIQFFSIVNKKKTIKKDYSFNLIITINHSLLHHVLKLRKLRKFP